MGTRGAREPSAWPAAIFEYAGATVTAVDFTSEAPTLDRFIQRLFPTGRPTLRPVKATVKSTQMETAKGGKVLLTPWMR